MKTIGIIGGGQLGMFLALHAYRMGYKTVVYDVKDDCCAKPIAGEFILGSFGDEEKLEEFCKKCDVITFEFENINKELITKLAKKYPIVQRETPLVISSSRLNEKSMADDLGIPVPKWQYIATEEEVKDLDLKYPFLMKSNSLGYDGKGQYMIHKEEDLKNVEYGVPYLAEEVLDFDYEISIIAFRSITGEFDCYEPFNNMHHKGILNITINNPDIPKEVANQAKSYIEKIMNGNDILGILCCEFFVKDDIVYFNEMAPRPHNSGHITMDTHYFSQFENHLRAILGLPLGSCQQSNNGFMVNVLGQDVEKAREYMAKHGDSARYYDYHKEPVHNRKVGHLAVYDYQQLDWFIENWK